MKRLALSALFLAGFAVAAGAAELRPLDNPTVCLDGSQELKAGERHIRKITLADCNREQTQNARQGEKNTISIGSLCLQAIAVGQPEGKPPVYEVLAAPCTGGPGQRWAMLRDGRLTSGEKLCLGVEAKDGQQRVTMVPCKEPPEDRTGQRWAVYGKF
ncbi:hypothetical protein IZ6_12320 [Terrihabitans soli]|uniref:Ricin B lectin domain-containing protein n=1 Tax=Terrihabitans soli TaxID=708113 RepID=A0A6S6QRB3_9HYPH|nr:ricin-type beta-trefoil lectin domain protein [Terrihabitans soli]BCJ90497.1 hypothetical protein IZ6_12320 [Terrihabitans soli]